MGPIYVRWDPSLKVYSRQQYFKEAIYKSSDDLWSTYNSSGQSAPVIAYSNGPAGHFDGNLPHVWGLGNNTNPGPNDTIWVSEHLPLNGDQTDDPYAAGGITEDPTTPPSQATSPIGLWGRDSVVEAITVIDLGTTNPTPDTKGGLGLGCSFVNNIGATSTKAFVLLYARMDTLTWEIATARGNGGSVLTKTLSGVDPPQEDRSFRMQLVYSPMNYEGFIAGVINGIEGGRITDTTKFPLITRASNQLVGATFFEQSGTAAGAIVNFAFWYPKRSTFFRIP